VGVLIYRLARNLPCGRCASGGGMKPGPRMMRLVIMQR